MTTDLKITFETVAISGNQPFKNVAVYDKKLQNPEFITPLGIGAMSSIYKGCDFFSITINGKKQMLLNYRESKVLDALLLSSIKPQNLIGFPVRSINYYIDGKRYNKKGENAVPGELFVNGELASIDTKIKQGDVIIAKEAIPGKQPTITIKELKEQPEFRFSVIVDEVLAEVPVIFYKDGQQLADDYIIKPMDRITTESVITLTDLLDYMETTFQPEEMTMMINNSIANQDTLIAAGDQISFIPKQQQEQISEELSQQNEMEVIAQQQLNTQQAEQTEEEKIYPEVTMKTTENEMITQQNNLEQSSEQIQQIEQMEQNQMEQNQIEQNQIEQNQIKQTEQILATEQQTETNIAKGESPHLSENADSIVVCINNVWKTIPLNNRKKLLFYDMLNYVDIDLEKPQGNIILKLNGEDTAYTASVSQGDSIEIAWDKPE